MGFTDEELRAWVLDEGTRFVPPQNKYDDSVIQYGTTVLVETSAERKQLTDEDVRRALLMLGGAVDIDLEGGKLLTDAVISEIGRGCPGLQTLILWYASPRAAPASRARRFRLSHARARSTPFFLSSVQPA